MQILRTLLASLLILVAGAGALTSATDGFRAFTSEGARRIAVRRQPRAIPDVPLETADGRRLGLGELRGRWLLVDFIYSRCGTYCALQGGDFARLQEGLAGPIRDGRVVLLSISFDLAHDEPARLAEYQRRFSERADGWLVARPMDADELASLCRVFGVTAVPDGRGGFVHNAAIAVVDPHGRLVDVLDWNDPAGAARYVTARLGT